MQENLFCYWELNKNSFIRITYKTFIIKNIKTIINIMKYFFCEFI